MYQQSGDFGYGCVTGQITGAVLSPTAYHNSYPVGWFDDLGKAVGGAANAVGGAVTGAANAVTSTVGGAVSGAINAAGGAYQAATRTAGSLYNQAARTAGSAANAAVKTVGGASQAIGGAVSGAIGAAGQAAQQAVVEARKVATQIATSTDAASKEAIKMIEARGLSAAMLTKEQLDAAVKDAQKKIDEAAKIAAWEASRPKASNPDVPARPAPVSDPTLASIHRDNWENEIHQKLTAGTIYWDDIPVADRNALDSWVGQVHGHKLRPTPVQTPAPDILSGAFNAATGAVSGVVDVTQKGMVDLITNVQKGDTGAIFKQVVDVAATTGGQAATALVAPVINLTMPIEDEATRKKREEFMATRAADVIYNIATTPGQLVDLATGVVDVADEVFGSGDFERTQFADVMKNDILKRDEIGAHVPGSQFGTQAQRDAQEDALLPEFSDWVGDQTGQNIWLGGAADLLEEAWKFKRDKPVIDAAMGAELLFAKGAALSNKLVKPVATTLTAAVITDEVGTGLIEGFKETGVVSETAVEPQPGGQQPVAPQQTIQYVPQVQVQTQYVAQEVSVIDDAAMRQMEQEYLSAEERMREEYANAESGMKNEYEDAVREYEDAQRRFDEAVKQQEEAYRKAQEEYQRQLDEAYRAEQEKRQREDEEYLAELERQAKEQEDEYQKAIDSYNEEADRLRDYVPESETVYVDRYVPVAGDVSGGIPLMPGGYRSSTGTMTRDVVRTLIAHEDGDVSVDTAPAAMRSGIGISPVVLAGAVGVVALAGMLFLPKTGGRKGATL